MKLAGKKILVTGADGFIGSHLVEELLEGGCSVRAFVFYNAFNSWGWLDSLPENIKKKIEVFPGDVRDPNGVRKAIAGIDVVFHLAALIGIPFSYHSPDSYIDTNVKGTLNVLQAGRDLGTEKIIVTSTSEVYGSALYVPIDEQHPLQAQSPYSASKIAADKLAESFYLSFGTPVTLVRPFNAYGPRQSVRAVIPTIITQLLSGAEKIKLGNTSTRRDFNYVKDTVKGFIAVAELDATGGDTFNLASQNDVSISHVFELIKNRVNPNATILEETERVRPPQSEVQRLLGSSAKVMALTAWRSCVALDEGLQKTIEWFKAQDNLARFKYDRYNI
ncbi:MAG: SDR family NAD(P)-dependent oxidoreductase [Spirochaetales bacterium]|nr:SDR family NAD(P)-dependent oxidoreductase [Spirochaetales bacterium]